MKKLICCICLCLVITFSSAQDRWGIKYGVGYSSFMDGESEFRFAKLVGLSKGWKISQKFSLGTEFLFSTRGSKIMNVKVWRYPQNTGCRCDIDYSALYTEFPLLIKYCLISKKKILFQMYTGFSYKISFLDSHGSTLRIKENLDGEFDISTYKYYQTSGEEGPLNSGFDFTIGYNVEYSLLHFEMRYCRFMHDNGDIGDIEIIYPYNNQKRTHAFFIIFGILL